MANGYIGKISAVVTANTSDLSRKLQGAVKDVDRFAQTLNRSVSASAQQATASLEKIFTPLQRLERRLQTALQLNLRTDDEVRKIQQLVSVAEGINKPLERAAGSFSKLSLEVQGAFLPALNRAQDAAVNLSNTLQQQGSVSATSFRQVEQSVERTTQAIQRLTQAQQLASQSLSGNELQFGNPRLFETLTANAQATRRAAALPAAALEDGSIARQIRALQQYQNAAVEAAARVESLRLEPNVRPEVLLAAERRLQGLVETARRAGIEIEKAIEAASPSAAIARANARLTIAPDQPPPPPPRTDLGNRPQQAGADRVRGLTGNLNIDSTPVPGVFNQQAQRDIDALASRVGQVRQQLETLPNSVRTQFIPALQQAQQQLTALQNAPGATVEEIENAAAAVTRIEQNARRAQSALNFRGGGIEGLNRSLDERAVQGYSAQLQILQGALGRVSAEAAGPGVAAQNRLRSAIADAMQDGTIRTERQRQTLERLTAEAVEATAAVAGVGAGGLGRQVQRAGDIGRGGFDRFTLGVNQAVFAIDDFFSVTGGIEQRLRAVGNNLTQLGFIVGGTGGLITALGAVLIGQGLAAFIRFSNGGASAEQQTKLLNDSLARQKSLVEELAEAFRSLGDALANRVFSEPAQEARRLSREIDEIAKKQRELLEARAADLDAGVQRSRVRQRVLQEEFDNSTDAGRRVFLQRQINEERQREQEAARAAVTRRPAAGEAREAVREALTAFLRAERAGLRGEAAERQARIDAERVAAAAAAVPAGNRPEDVLTQLRELRAAAAQAPEGTGRPFFFGQFGGGVNSPELVRLQQLITSLETPLRQALDELSNQISRASFITANEIEAAQGDVADAIRRGVRGAGDFQAALDNTARQLAEAQAQVAAAQEIDDVDRREVEVRRAQGRVRDIENRIDAINERAREVRLGRTFGGERTTDALSGLSGERFINEEAGLRARLRAAIDAEEQARRSVEAAIQRGDEAARQRAIADLEAAQAASDLSAAAAEAAIALEQAFARIRQTAENIVSQSEGIADDAQRRLDEQDPQAPGAVDRDELRRDRDEAERQLIQDRRRERELQNRLDRERAEAANDPAVAVIDRELERLRSEREEAAADARLNGNFEDPRAAERRENEIARLEAEREERIRQQTAGTQALIDKENQLIAARRRAAEEIQRQRDFEAEVARRRNPEGDAIRGLDLLENPGQRAGRELRQQIADINAAFDRNVEAILGRAGGRPQDARAELDAARADRDAAVERARQDAFRAQAPAIFGLADAVQNAILQGPSRAALEATDVSSVSGAGELNRLLRGDDAARNQDLVQLQREANRLLQLIADGGADIAN